MKFENALDPTEDELREWASDPNAEYPEEMSQDWDLVLADIRYASTLIKLSCENSPNRKFFLSCLYTLSGDCARVRVNEAPVKAVRATFAILPKDAPSDVVLWKNRSENLFNEPSLYNYDGWGWGDLARDKENQ